MVFRSQKNYVQFLGLSIQNSKSNDHKVKKMKAKIVKRRSNREIQNKYNLQWINEKGKIYHIDNLYAQFFWEIVHRE